MFFFQDATEKQTYVKKAEEDKERYNREFSDYQRTDAYKQFVTMQNERDTKLAEAQTTPGGNAGAAMSTAAGATASGSKKKKVVKAGAIKKEEDSTSPGLGSFLDIPIFREDFLEHNKSREAELKLLRKQVKTDHGRPEEGSVSASKPGVVPQFWGIKETIRGEIFQRG